MLPAWGTGYIDIGWMGHSRAKQGDAKKAQYGKVGYMTLKLGIDLKSIPPNCHPEALQLFTTLNGWEGLQR